jgi:LPS-assembly lipoprotein
MTRSRSQPAPLGSGPLEAARRRRACGLIALLLAAFAAAALPGCGFELRGAAEIPPELDPIFVQSRGGSRVREAIRELLAFSTVGQAATAEDAKLVLRIRGESRSSRLAAVDRDGKVVATELFLAVEFDAVDSEGKPFFDLQRIELSRVYENPDVEVLGKQLERDLIYDDLTQEAADQVLDRLRAALR